MADLLEFTPNDVGRWQFQLTEEVYRGQSDVELMRAVLGADHDRLTYMIGASEDPADPCANRPVWVKPASFQTASDGLQPIGHVRSVGLAPFPT